MTDQERDKIERRSMATMAGFCAFRMGVEAHEACHVIVALAFGLRVLHVSAKSASTEIECPVDQAYTIERQRPDTGRRPDGNYTDLRKSVMVARILHPDATWQQLHRYLRDLYVRTFKVIRERRNFNRGGWLARALEIRRELDEREIGAVVRLADHMLFMRSGTVNEIFRGKFDNKILKAIEERSV